MEEHRAALRWDFRHYLGLDLAEVGRSIPWRDSIDYVREMLREYGSHTSANVRGYDFAVSYGDLMAGVHATSFVNSNRDPKKNPHPIELLWPWPDERERSKRESEVTPEERAALMATLHRYSGVPKAT